MSGGLPTVAVYFTTSRDDCQEERCSNALQRGSDGAQAPDYKLFTLFSREISSFRLDPSSFQKAFISGEMKM